jgi:phosphoribosylformylglycinamidine synthase subunit PurSL
VNEVPARSPLSDVARLFSETPSRFLVEVPAVAQKAFEAILKGHAAPIGRVTQGQKLTIRNSQTKALLIDEPLAALLKAWETL